MIQGVFVRSQSLFKLNLSALSCVRAISYKGAMKGRNGKRMERGEDLHTTVLIDELQLDDYLSPTKKSLIEKAKLKYINFMSEFNIKRKLSSYKVEEVAKTIPEMMERLQQFYALDEMKNASLVVIPPLLKKLQDFHPKIFTIKQLQPFHKDLRFVGYSTSYLDRKPEVLQTRVVQKNKVMYAQLTVGVYAVEDVYGWTNRGKKVQLQSQFPVELPVIGGKELPLESKQSKWIETIDSSQREYFYNDVTKLSSWTNPDEYSNIRRLRAYLLVIERPLFSTMGVWRFHKF